MLQSLDARLDQSLSDIQRRVDRLQEAADQEAVRSVSSRLPEAIRKIDGLVDQCQDLEARERALEVRLDMMRATVDGHEQQLFIFSRRSLAGLQVSLPHERGGDAAA